VSDDPDQPWRGWLRAVLALMSVITIVLIVLGGSALWPRGVAARPAGLHSTLDWLRGQQNADGGFGSPASDSGIATETALAFIASGIAPTEVQRGGISLHDYLLRQAPTYSRRPAGAAKLVLVVQAAGQSPRAFGGVDLVQAIGQPGAEGQYGQSLYEHAYCLLALSSVGTSVPTVARERLLRTQIADGSWSFAGSGQPGEGDTNTTAIVLQALVAIGQERSPAIARALRYLQENRASEGGFAYNVVPGTPAVADANSTAVVAQALLAVDEPANGAGWGRSIDRLRAFRNGNGSFRWKDDQLTDSNLFATVQALPALAGYYLPFDRQTASGTRARRLAARSVSPPAVTDQERLYFAETGHSLAYAFRRYWESQGGLERFGFPLTEEFRELNPDDGAVYTVQYFERARLEYHPAERGTSYEVQAGLLGRQLTQGWSESAFARRAEAGPGCLVFAETGHTICEQARRYWEERGGLDGLGLPISEPFGESEGTRQYFERARLELRGGQASLGLLGRELLYPAVG
jgi:hypothetical protein